MQTDLSTLNPQQKDAILQSIDHNVVLLAGAGAGKTFTLVKRVEYLIVDHNVDPENIMVVTFTNKAANEIKERMSKISDNAYKMWIGTFHKICIRLLRKFGDRLGITQFSIIDTKDAKNLIKDILDDLGEEYDKETIKKYQSIISSFKNNLRNKSDVANDPEINSVTSELYTRYMDTCWAKKTFDFDDLIIYTILLLSTYEEVSDWVHENIKYLMVDECQDTNSSQFVLIKLIAGDNNTLLVGDVNQSIYAFRNAKPEYLENYADTTPNTIKLKLEQNYRSTKNIINAANKVVANNGFGTKLEMFCDNEEGSKVLAYRADSSYIEAQWVVEEILGGYTFQDKPFSDYAIIYRANYQSRVFEQELTKRGVPYVVFGSTSFYSRKEVRDLLAFCKIVINPFDIPAFTRVLKTINGVGKATIDKIIKISNTNKVTLAIALEDFINNSASGSQKKKLEPILTFLNANYFCCEDIVTNVFHLTEYRSRMVAIGTEESYESVGYMNEFRDMITSFEEKNPDMEIADIIDEISLLSDAKGAEKAEQDAVKLMTAHSSKGLEFDTVFVVDAHEGSFPHQNSIDTGRVEDIEEERRLFYVAMTRAQKKLYITSCKSVRQSDMNVPALASRFIKEIPDEYLHYTF